MVGWRSPWTGWRLVAGRTMYPSQHDKRDAAGHAVRLVDEAAALRAMAPGNGRVILGHDVRDPANRQHVLRRKGAQLSRAELETLLQSGARALHLLLPDEGDLAEDPAAERLAQIVAGPHVQAGEAHHGQATLSSEVRGIARVNTAALDQVNAQPGVLAFTVEPDQAVDSGHPVGAAKCSPLLLPAAAIAAVQRAVNEHGPVLRVDPFLGRTVAFVVTDRIQPATLRRAEGALKSMLDWLGSPLAPTVPAGATAASVGEAYRTAARQRPGVILVAGGSATDPEDIVFAGLRQAGGSVDWIGVPVDPGTACWIGQIEGVPVFGLASCELFGQPGAVDLVLPPVLAGEALRPTLLRRLAVGGMLGGRPGHAAGVPYARPWSA